MLCCNYSKPSEGKKSRFTTFSSIQYFSIIKSSIEYTPYRGFILKGLPPFEKKRYLLLILLGYKSFFMVNCVVLFLLHKKSHLLLLLNDFLPSK